MRINRIVIALAVVSVLVACGSTEHQDLRDYIVAAKQAPKGRIDPLPTFRPYKAFTYGAVRLRSPFDKPVIEEKEFLFSSDEKVQPDLNREKEYLEGFNISSLQMVGTLTKGGVLWTLVDDGEGGVHRVTLGNYLGKNHGKIVSADNGQVDVLEIVPDGLDGYVQRPRTLKIEEKE